MQEITLIGNMGKDPEERETPTGKKVTTFSLAVSPRKNETVWYECQIWENKLPQFSKVLEYLKKGTRLLVRGDLKTPCAYQSKDGAYKVRLQMELSFIKMIGSIGEKNESSPKEQSIFAEEIPF